MAIVCATLADRRHSEYPDLAQSSLRFPQEAPRLQNHSAYSLFVRYTSTAMFQGPPARIHPFVITCKRCRENIAAPVQTMPDSWIIHTCPLCGERRRYLPAEISR